MKYLSTTVRGLPQNVTKAEVRSYFNNSPDVGSSVVGPIVKDARNASCSTTVTFQNKKHGRSCEKIRDSFHSSAFHGGSATISVTDNFLGLTALAGEPGAPVHIYFVHGLGGHAFNTWSSEIRRDDLSTLKTWPRDFLPDRLQKEGVEARVYTIGYNANLMKEAAKDATIESAAEDLLAGLYGERSSVKPREIYFICHSLGGLVVCQALATALFEEEDYPNKPQYKDLFLKGQECLVKGVTFMGTPFNGSGYANLFGPFIKAIRQLNDFTAVNDSFVNALNTRQPVDVTKTVNQFYSVMRQRNIRLVIGCEERPVAGSKLVTTYKSAGSRFGTNALVFRIQGRDHRQMVKFGEKHDAQYTNLENHIIRMIKSDEASDISAPTVETSHQYQELSDVKNQSSADDGDRKWERSLQNITYINNFGPGGGPRNHSSHSIDEERSRDINHNATDNRFNAMGGRVPPRRYFSGHGGMFQREAHPLRSTETSEAIGDASQSFGDMRLGSQAPRRRTFGPSHTSPNDNDKLFNRLIMFDTVFILDDTGSMVESVNCKDKNDITRWEAAKQALEHVGGIAMSKDTDGVDLRFLKADSNVDNITDIEDLVDKLNSAEIDEFGGGTFFQEQLEEVIHPRLVAYREFKQKLEAYDSQARQHGLSRPKKPKYLNLIVITDGSADDRPEVEDYIIKVARELDHLEAGASQIGIQFVQIGDDSDAAGFLRHLDNDLKHQTNPPIRDMVDTTPFHSALAQESGSFLELLEKVLLGAITKDIDERENGFFFSQPVELHDYDQ